MAVSNNIRILFRRLQTVKRQVSNYYCMFDNSPYTSKLRFGLTNFLHFNFNGSIFVLLLVVYLVPTIFGASTAKVYGSDIRVDLFEPFPVLRHSPITVLPVPTTQKPSQEIADQPKESEFNSTSKIESFWAGGAGNDPKWPTSTGTFLGSGTWKVAAGLIKRSTKTKPRAKVKVVRQVSKDNSISWVTSANPYSNRVRCTCNSGGALAGFCKRYCELSKMKSTIYSRFGCKTENSNFLWCRDQSYAVVPVYVYPFDSRNCGAKYDVMRACQTITSNSCWYEGFRNGLPICVEPHSNCAPGTEALFGWCFPRIKWIYKEPKRPILTKRAVDEDGIDDGDWECEDEDCYDYYEDEESDDNSYSFSMDWPDEGQFIN